ncbi:MAG: lactoylglutathione lyase [Gammaproteobacteria bacterium]|nr:lactoylglutathione lyase [Gammaproteobacteria bacterium]
MKYLHSMLRVTDLDASIRFYCEQLGLQEVRRNDYPKGKFTLVFLATPDDIERYGRTDCPMLELTHNWEPEDYTGGRNFGHLAFQVDNIFQTCETLQKAGVIINRPPRDGRMAFVRSPDNISIELLQIGEALEVIEPWASMPNSGEW